MEMSHKFKWSHQWAVIGGFSFLSSLFSMSKGGCQAITALHVTLKEAVKVDCLSHVMNNNCPEQC